MSHPENYMHQTHLCPPGQRCVFVIGAATLVSGEHAINAWETWMGGCELLFRTPADDPEAVWGLAYWAVSVGGFWQRWDAPPGTAGRPVESAGEVVRIFTH